MKSEVSEEESYIFQLRVNTLSLESQIMSTFHLWEPHNSFDPKIDWEKKSANT